jgi:hypothetical protein
MNYQRPTELHEKANAEAMVLFAEHLKQLKAICENLHNLERNLPATADAVSKAALPSSGCIIQADDGTEWRHSIELMKNVSFCDRCTAAGVEFAIVESLPLKSGERKEVLNSGHDAQEVLRTFVRDQRQVLQVWIDDVIAQVQEHLAEKHPHQDMSIVVESFEIKLARAISRRETLAQNHSRGIHI